MTRVAVVGCGGIGGVIAANLARAGVDVTAVTGNAAVAGALSANGYRVTEFDGSMWSTPAGRAPVISLRDGRPPGAPFDVVILATKATTLAEVTGDALPHLAPGGVLVACQNGLPEDVAASVAGRERVLGNVVVWGASMTEPGVYLRTSRGHMQLGRPWPEAPDPAPIAKLLEPASETRVVDDLLGVRWTKLAINCATSTIGAIGGDRLGALLRRRFVRRLTLELWTEFLAVARASGIRPAVMSGLDLEKMALSPSERTQKLGSPSLTWKHSLLVAVAVKYRRMRSSMLIAIERGRTPEIDFLNGEIVRRGRQLGVPVPINARLVQTVWDIVARREQPGIALLRRIFEEETGETAPASTLPL